MSEIKNIEVDTLVLGGGPGGYTAAFRAADLGQSVALIEKRAILGGVCLNEGCIPSKALLHLAQVINEAGEAHKFGIKFAKPELDLDGIRGHKDSVVGALTKGLGALAKQRKVQVLTGTGTFSSSSTLTVKGEDETEVSFKQAIIATGSSVLRLPMFPFDDPRVMDSTDALKLEEVPGSLLIVGGGIIGMEMATVYNAFGSEVSVVELMDQIIPPADPDLVKPLARMYKKKLKAIYTSVKVTKVEPQDKGLLVSFEGDGAPEPALYDKILVSIGRRPNTEGIGLENLGISPDERGFITVNEKRQTKASNIYAIGDITGQPMLAHKAVHEGRVAAEVISGEPAEFSPVCIPSVAYTDPEIAWTGLTEKDAAAQGIAYEKGVFPWAASGRSLSNGRNEGITKILYDPKTKRVLGAGICGNNAGELLAEANLAVEMGADLEDVSLTIHAHPTLSETFALAAEMAEGTITDLMPPKK
ncbi:MULTISPECIES: dihydrolipoyl dehydrogenase [unclassified Oceanispirochaeta]|uniref:dihydrolipoyl dehydrogenase n=1 Tax=unclassified Oceanispirochaeta TaxID=2635722 RepID=UPI000E098762|nr:MULTISPECIES: dihydrolipoyl dehydrogenase [unclassified Oceanispirochaeta]MBF9014119.1 dihydrolipoyl dehydrogenase [Oceanispirochaeta sp. M2]NPD70610.1 dihydrolipoyl dehydrogenase [Oceanispirochaeta sp. M1]RDG34375.1 dihydrolipoyl dehydrogenase [Oceanispirochaeta sp. M1]